MVGKADVSFSPSLLAVLSAIAFGSSLSTHPPTGLLFTKGCRRICGKNKRIYFHPPSSSAVWGRAVQLMMVEESGEEVCKHSWGIAGHALLEQERWVL